MKARKPKTISVNINGSSETVIAFNIGHLAFKLGRSPAAIRGWEKMGLLPKTPFTVGGKAERVYTDAMINAIKDVVDSRGGNVTKGDEMFYREIVAKWNELGIKVD